MKAASDCDALTIWHSEQKWLIFGRVRISMKIHFEGFGV